MTTRRVSAFLDAIAAGRRPRWRHGEPEPDDVTVMRTAIELRAARPGDSSPNEDFVVALHRQLADEFNPPQGAEIRSLRSHRGRTLLVAAAAAVALVGGAVAVTDAANRHGVTSVAFPAPHDHVLRTGTFEAPGGRVLGQIVVYPGHPGWVFMNVNAVSSYGSVMCKLHLTNGSVVAAGTVSLHDGMGQLSKAVSVDARRLRDATLYSPSGTALGSAPLA
jgi:hypothetical protein